MPTWVRVRVPVRVLDAGGWTDTWFARRGTVCNLAVEDGTEVVAARLEGARRERGTVELHLRSFGERYRVLLGAAPPGRHPVIEAALRRFAPPDAVIEVEVAASVPPGSGLGTSASVVVGVIAALQALDGDVAAPSHLGRDAHRVETVDARLQSGVQDQIAAAHGGASLIEIDAYPAARVRALGLAPSTWDALDRRVLTVYLGASRRSDAVHQAVISRLDAQGESLLAPLRDAAGRAARALVAGSIDEYGEAMIANTEAQRALHPALVNPLADRVIELARQHGVVGWKVNGAGGEGGTLTLVTPDEPGGIIHALSKLDGVAVLPLRPARQGARIIDQG